MRSLVTFFILVFLGLDFSGSIWAPLEPELEPATALVESLLETITDPAWAFMEVSLWSAKVPVLSGRDGRSQYGIEEPVDGMETSSTSSLMRYLSCNIM